MATVVTATESSTAAAAAAGSAPTVIVEEVAAERAGKNSDDVTKSERQAAKAINFGLIFGAGAKTLRQQAIASYGLDMSLEEAIEAKAFFHSKYERLTEWQKESVADANALGYSESPYINT